MAGMIIRFLFINTFKGKKTCSNTAGERDTFIDGDISLLVCAVKISLAGHIN